MSFVSALLQRRCKPGHNTPHRTPPPAALFPTRAYTASVRAWATSIQGLVESQECRLRRIVHCKAKSGSCPEFVLVYVRHPSGRDAIVCVERDASFAPSSECADDAPPPYDKAMDMHALGIPPSGDRVQLSSDGTEASVTRHIPAGWTEIHTVKFSKPSEAPSVAHLAALLTMLDRHLLSPSASVEVRSGWFAYCVVEVLREVFGGEAKRNKDWNRVPYGGMKVERRDTVDALIREFTPAWDEFSRRWNGRPTKRTEPRREGKQAQMGALVDMLRTMHA